MFNWVDLIIILILLLFALDALGRSFIFEILDFFSFLTAFFLSFVLYHLPAQFLEKNFGVTHSLSLVLGFFTVWILTELIFSLVVSRFLIPLLIKARFRVPGERVLSAVPALFRGLIFIALILVVVAAFPIRPDIKKAVISSSLGSEILRSAYQLEGPVKNVFGGVSQDTLSFLTIKPKTTESVNLGFRTSEFKEDPVLEELMIRLVNRERQERGVKTLSLDNGLRSLARGHSEDMFKRGYFSHYSPEGKDIAQRANEAKINFLTIGENLAYAPTLELAHRGLMNSPGHRANILSPDFNKVGIGILDGGVYGLMVTQVFSN